MKWNSTPVFSAMLSLITSGSLYAQQEFVELRREISCFDNTKCINQEFNVSLPLFDTDAGGKILAATNDSIYQIAGKVLSDMNQEVSFTRRSWKDDQADIDSCEDGISKSETRELYYSILYNEDDILSFAVRNNWILEQQKILESDLTSAEQQLVYCFTLDLKNDVLMDVNTLFPAANRPRVIEMIRNEYDHSYEEDMVKAGDRLRFCGLLISPIELLAVYVRMLPDDQSEVRSVELPLSEIHDLMHPFYQDKFKLHEE
ncbi:MAG: hypothetical protein JNL88_01340 [Bacteroidia bacterium]|nr:hypothetical protein [Bacteroidia bacterium]